MSKNTKQRVQVFELIRDIPYQIGLDGEPDFCCSSKAEHLKNLLRMIETDSRYRLCRFNWEDLSLPDVLLELYHESPEFHQYLEAFVPEKGSWVPVDATWDSGLKKILPISEWDGVNATQLAVKPIEVYSLKKTREELKADEAEPDEPVYKGRDKRFLKALNKYFDAVRKGEQTYFLRHFSDYKKMLDRSRPPKALV